MRQRRYIIPAVVLATIALTFQSAKSDDRNFGISKSLTVFHDIFRDIDMLYVDTADMESLMKTGIDAMLNELDPYTRFYPQDNDSELKIMTTGRYAGIGAIIRQYPQNRYVAIEEPYENMPAYRSGLKAGDLILAIDGNSMEGRTTSYVSERLRGNAGTHLTLSVLRPGCPDSLEIGIVRNNVTLPSVPFHGIYKGIGYIILDSFTENCSDDVRKALLELKEEGASSIVMDLRGNGGGLLSEAVEIVGLFVPKGTMVVETKGRNRQVSNSYRTQRAPVDEKIPLAVITDGSSASASEILSGALQDLDRAVIIGSRTYGKGLVQSTRQTPFGGTLKITTSKYYIPSGRCIQEIDYSRHDASGRAERIPDSLTTVFHTASGREVRDGGGITPDIKCAPDTMPDILYYLSTDVVLFNFLNDYCAAHDTIAPADRFIVSDSLYDAFTDYVTKSDFKFTSRSSAVLETLREIAEFEGLAGKASDELNSLKKKLQYDMKHDLDTFKTEIKNFIGSGLTTRYHYQKGTIQYNMRYDAVLDSAISVLNDKERYNAVLGRRGRR